MNAEDLKRLGELKRSEPAWDESPWVQETIDWLIAHLEAEMAEVQREHRRGLAVLAAAQETRARLLDLLSHTADDVIELENKLEAAEGRAQKALGLLCRLQNMTEQMRRIWNPGEEYKALMAEIDATLFPQAEPQEDDPLGPVTDEELDAAR